MKLKSVLFSIFCFQFSVMGYAQNHEIFSQTVYMKEYENTVTQGQYNYLMSNKFGFHYLGVWMDLDEKTSGNEVYTDAQVSPLIGFKTNLYFEKYLPSRAFVEARYVHRTVEFFDNRKRNTTELRAGLLGYDKILKDTLFLEHYYALMYTKLYNDRIILQGWSKQGVFFNKYLDVFNEFMVDTFDQVQGQDATFDARPGIRVNYPYKTFKFTLQHQFVHHFTNNFVKRDEERTSLILGGAF